MPSPTPTAPPAPRAARMGLDGNVWAARYKPLAQGAALSLHPFASGWGVLWGSWADKDGDLTCPSDSTNTPVIREKSLCKHTRKIQ